MGARHSLVLGIGLLAIEYVPAFAFWLPRAALGYIG